MALFSVLKKKVDTVKPFNNGNREVYYNFFFFQSSMTNVLED